jgi:hypothetical protein
VGNVNNVDGLASILGCGVSSLPLKYLSLSLGAFFLFSFFSKKKKKKYFINIYLLKRTGKALIHEHEM